MERGQQEKMDRRAAAGTYLVDNDDRPTASPIASHAISIMSPDKIESLYKSYHNSMVYSSDIRFLGLIGLVFAVKTILESQRLGSADSEALPFTLGHLIMACTIVIGLGPIVFFSWFQKARYIAWREFFVFNALFWTILRYYFTLQLLTVASSAYLGANFLIKAIAFGPHAIVLTYGIGFPLRTQAAFPFIAFAGIGTAVCAFLVHSQLISEPAAQPGLHALYEKVCATGFYKEFVLASTGMPCDASNVLLNVWNAGNGLAVLVMLFFNFFEESSRRKRFFLENGLQEPYPLYFHDHTFSHTSSIVVFIFIGLVLFYLAGLHLEIVDGA